jgi:hypothetical protein
MQTLTCSCGKRYNVSDEVAQRRPKCKACGSPLQHEHPSAIGDLDVLTVDAADTSVRRRGRSTQSLLRQIPSWIRFALLGSAVGCVFLLVLHAIWWRWFLMFNVGGHFEESWWAWLLMPAAAVLVAAALYPKLAKKLGVAATVILTAYVLLNVLYFTQVNHVYERDKLLTSLCLSVPLAVGALVAVWKLLCLRNR